MRALLMTSKKKWSCYLPIDANDTTSTIYDHSGNGNDFSWGYTGEFETLSSGKRVLSLNATPAGTSTYNYIYKNGIPTLKKFTINMWGYNGRVIFSEMKSSGGKYYGVTLYPYRLSIGYGTKRLSNTEWTNPTGWYNICCTINNTGNQKIYINGTEIASSTTNPSFLSDTQNITIGDTATYSLSNVKIGTVIIESGDRTAQEVLDYYNSTKSDYGLS